MVSMRAYLRRERGLDPDHIPERLWEGAVEAYNRIIRLFKEHADSKISKQFDTISYVVPQNAR